MPPLRRISIISPAFNEEGNVRRCYEEVKAVMAGLPTPLTASEPA